MNSTTVSNLGLLYLWYQMRPNFTKRGQTSIFLGPPLPAGFARLAKINEFLPLSYDAFHLEAIAEAIKI